MTWHDLFTLLNLPIETSRHDMTSIHYRHSRINIVAQYIRYAGEYIPKLQLHQHSLLTRKVFSWYSSSTQVFITWSSSTSLLLLSRANGDISQLYLALEVLQSQPFFMLVVGLNTYIWPWEAHLATMSKRPNTYIWPWEAHPATMSERFFTYIWPWEAQPSIM